VKNNKPAVILASAIAALFVISFVIRFVALSELGLPGGWTLYFGLPVGGIGLLIILLRLGLLNFGQGPTAAPTTQRLQEIENLRASGAISDEEYTAERARIIASL
jgi:hypothetical protein